MTRFVNHAALAASVAALACGRPMSNVPPFSADPASSSPVTANSADNPLLRPWSGAYGGVPPFDKVEVAHFEPALEAAMLENLAEVDRIARDPAPATFENTIAALERAGRAYDRVIAVYGVWGSSMNGPEFQAVQRKMAPRLAAFSDRITQNSALFQRIATVYESPSKARLTPEQQRLAWLYHNNFVRAGARLAPAAKQRVAEINQGLAGLFTRFGQNVLADETDIYFVLDSEAELAGLSQAVKDAAAAAAAQKGLQGKWVITNTRSAMDPFLTSSTRRDLREKAWRLFVNRGDNGGEHDNNRIISEILALRAERAKLLGYETHAH